MVLGVFIEFFRVKIVIGLSKNRCDLFITVRLANWFKSDHWIIIYPLEIIMNH